MNTFLMTLEGIAVKYSLFGTSAYPFVVDKNALNKHTIILIGKKNIC